MQMLYDRLFSQGYKVKKAEFQIHNAQQNWINDFEIKGYDLLILNGYMLDQLVHALANTIDLDRVIEMQRYMRKPDIDIVIDIPVEESMRKESIHINGQCSIRELDLEILMNAREDYILLPNEHSAQLKLIVNGMLTVDELHEEIYNIIFDNIIHGENNHNEVNNKL